MKIKDKRPNIGSVDVTMKHEGYQIKSFPLHLNFVVGSQIDIKNIKTLLFQEHLL